VTLAVRTDRLSKHYGHTVALEGLNLEIETGEVFGNLGPNGGGKSTTIALLLGTIRATAGQAKILDLDARRDAVAIHRRLAYVPSEANLWPSLTGAEALRFLGAIHGSGVITWSLLVDLLGSMVSGAAFLEHVSLFHSMALAPAQTPTLGNIVLTTAIALALCGGATFLFGRRDVRA
jgi:ABC-type sugar transport system ATPase subunit